jgi:hypothetical protein
MNGPSSRVLLPAVLVGVVGFVSLARAGGWGIVTLDDLPDHFVAGQPVELAFTARAHGVTPLSGVSVGAGASATGIPFQFSVVATDGAKVAYGTVSPEAGPGRYRAVITMPDAGSWRISIMGSNLAWPNGRLPATRTVDPGDGSAPAPLTASQRGLRLFVAKGCVSCHVHESAREMGQSLPVGPVLTGRRFPEAYLTGFLADPSAFRTAQTRPFPMPDLDLEPDEISALIAFLNSEG